MQYFKGDDLEIKFYEAFKGIVDNLEIQIDAFESGAFSAAPLGDLLYEDNRSPLANAISQDIYRDSFSEVFEAFTVAGTFESYLTVFRKIFGDEVEVDFTVPAAGKLNIDIIADEIVLSELVARSIVDGAYVFDNVVDDVGDQIVTQTVKGFQSQYELELMLHEMVPAGIYTEITLGFGS